MEGSWVVWIIRRLNVILSWVAFALTRWGFWVVIASRSCWALRLQAVFCLLSMSVQTVLLFSSRRQGRMRRLPEGMQKSPEPRALIESHLKNKRSVYWLCKNPESPYDISQMPKMFWWYLSLWSMVVTPYFSSFCCLIAPSFHGSLFIHKEEQDHFLCKKIIKFSYSSF